MRGVMTARARSSAIIGQNDGMEFFSAKVMLSIKRATI